MASLLGYLTAQVFTPDRLGIETGAVSMLAVQDVVIAAGFGVLTAGFGIVLLRGVGTCVRLLAHFRMNPALRPALGSAIARLLALVSPHAMSSGHGALHITGIFKLPWATSSLIFLLKS